MYSDYICLAQEPPTFLFVCLFVDTSGILTEGGGYNHKMAAGGDGASGRMALEKVDPATKHQEWDHFNYKSSTFQVKALFNCMPFKMNI